MEYTPIEKDVLSMMQRTDFTKLSKNDVISFASRSGELRPEITREILTQYPEFIKLMTSTLTEYKNIIYSIIESDDESLTTYNGIANKEMDSASNSRKQFYDFAKQDKVNKKDTEKREFDWKLIGSFSLVLVTVIVISAGVLGGKLDLKLQSRKT